jgi:hypothetical protein
VKSAAAAAAAAATATAGVSDTAVGATEASHCRSSSKSDVAPHLLHAVLLIAQRHFVNIAIVQAWQLRQPEEHVRRLLRQLQNALTTAWVPAVAHLLL